MIVAERLRRSGGVRGEREFAGDDALTAREKPKERAETAATKNQHVREDGIEPPTDRV